MPWAKEASELSDKEEIVCTAFVQKNMFSALNLSCKKAQQTCTLVLQIACTPLTV